MADLNSTIVRGNLRVTGDVRGGSLNASDITSGTLAAARLATSGVTANSYGPSANATPGFSGTFSVPYITVDSYGRITASSTKTVTIPSAAATTSAAGLMSATDKTRLDGLWTSFVEDDDNDTTVNRLRDILNLFSNWTEGNDVLTYLSNNYSGISHTHSFSDITAGNITLGQGSKYINLRSGHDSYDGGMYYSTPGNEAVIFANKSTVTSWIFESGLSVTSTSTSWQDFTGASGKPRVPSMQIKNQRVTINKLIANNTDADYNLDVNGTINGTTIYENGTTLANTYAAKGHNHSGTYAPASHSHTVLSYADTRDATYTPDQAAAVNGIKIEFKNKASSSIPSTGTWTGLITLDAYSDTSGGYPSQLGFSMSDLGETRHLYMRSPSSSSAWGDWQKIAFIGDIPTNNNQLTNGAGYITGIDSSMVTTALGYTPVNSSSAAVQNGETLSLVTTGEKYAWNSKATGSITDDTGSEAVTIGSKTLNVVTRDTAQDISGIKRITNSNGIDIASSSTANVHTYLKGSNTSTSSAVTITLPAKSGTVIVDAMFSYSSGTLTITTS